MEENLAANQPMTKQQPTVTGESSSTPRPPPPVSIKRKRRLAMLISAAVLILIAEASFITFTLLQAGLDLSYTRVIAPIAGHVTRRTVEEGAYVMTGQSLLILVRANVWVVSRRPLAHRLGDSLARCLSPLL